MYRDKTNQRIFRFLALLAVLVLPFGLTACGGDGGSDGDGIVDGGGGGEPTALFEAPPDTSGTVVGILDSQGSEQASAAALTEGTTVTLDDAAEPLAIDDEGRFNISNLQDGNHSLFVHHPDGAVTEIPFRMTEGRSLSLGTVSIRDGIVENHTGFDGFHFGFIDENNDGVNDLFMDEDGDGICDNAGLYAGYPYLMGHGWLDENGDRINDRFRDHDGDGLNDPDGFGPGSGFGFVDQNDDGVNDHFFDSDGDGINDFNGMPFRHPFGFVDDNGDGINDRFVDADGDGVNDRNQVRYIAMPGWADLDGDGTNDFFHDEDGDGINDLDDMPYGHAFGWVDENDDGINDRFIDADGDGVCDFNQGPFAQMPFFYGYARNHRDAQGDGIDDDTGFPYHHGFGWVDLDDDGINDAFADVDGDGVNDFTGHYYDHHGFRTDPGFTGDGPHLGPGDWPHQGGGMM